MVNDSKLTIAKQVCIVNNTHRKKNNNTTRVSNATQRQYVCVKTVCLRKDSMSTREERVAMSDKKQLVAYFSPTGNTRRFAEMIAKVSGADLFEIKPEIPYTTADLDWENPRSRSSVEMKDPTFRPMIKDVVASMQDYDVVFLGFPIWWYIAPTIINTFLESYDLAGKTIVPFATSGGSGAGETLAHLQPSAPQSTILEPVVITRSPLMPRVESWYAELAI